MNSTFGKSVVIILAILLGDAVVWAQLASSPWPDYGGGARNTHCSTYVGPSSNVQIAWEYDIPWNVSHFWNYAHAQAAITQDGTIVFCTYAEDDPTIVGLNPDGSQRYAIQELGLGRWVAADAAGNFYNTRYIPGSTSYRFVQSWNEDGTYRWGYSLPSSSETEVGPSVGPDGNVYMGNGQLLSLTASGSFNWSHTGSGWMDNPAFASDGTIITGGSYVRAFTPEGNEIWSYTTTNIARFAPVAIANNGIIYAGSGYGSSSDKVVALTSDGNELWTYLGAGGAPSIGPDGTIYAGYKGSVHAINPDGTCKWVYATGTIDEFGVEGVTVDADGNLYLANTQGILMSLSSEGQLRWSLDLAPDDPSDVWPSAPIIGDDGVIYVGGGQTGKFFAVVPEPASMSLLAIGAVAVLRRRRKKA